MKAKVYLTFFLFAVSLFSLHAQKSTIYAPANKAIRGYDPVAYFTKGVPTKGDDQYKVFVEGANWYFSSKENLDLFTANPEKYMPQYGGYCAFGVAGGYKASTSPFAWSVVEGKLYLNYNQKVQQEWSAERSSMIKKGDKNWPTVKINE
nr:YHS domain-containing protein [Cytophagales bacterium]